MTPWKASALTQASRPPARCAATTSGGSSGRRPQPLLDAQDVAVHHRDVEHADDRPRSRELRGRRDATPPIDAVRTNCMTDRLCAALRSDAAASPSICGQPRQASSHVERIAEEPIEVLQRSGSVVRGAANPEGSKGGMPVPGAAGAAGDSAGRWSGDADVAEEAVSDAAARLLPLALGGDPPS